MRKVNMRRLSPEESMVFKGEYFEELEPRDFFLHIPKKYEKIAQCIIHVDTQLRGDHWRVQGYIDKNEIFLDELCGLELNCDMAFADDGYIDFWRLTIPYKA